VLRGGDRMPSKRLLYLACVAMIIGLIILGVGYKLQTDKQQPKIVTTDTLQDTNALSKAINVPTSTAVQIQHEIQKVNEPVVSYYVQAPDIMTAAKQTQQAINSNSKTLPAVVTDKSDRTVITPNTEKQKVDVYKINLNKAHKVKVGLTVIDDKSYATIGYQAGRLDGMVHFKSDGKIKGATALYTVAEW